MPKLSRRGSDAMSRLKLSRLDPAKQIAAGSIITVVGKRNTGKSKIVQNLMYLLRDKFEFCISPHQKNAQAFF